MNFWAWMWVAWFGVFAVLEAVGLFWPGRGMTLTFFIQHHFARWFLAGFLGWLTFHFLADKPAKKAKKPDNYCESCGTTHA